MRVALVRGVSPRLGDCELTHLDRVAVDASLARKQHWEYTALLASLGLGILDAPALDAHPDGVFVEDTALVLDEIALLTRPGAPSRRAEVDSVAPILERFRPVERLVAPATADGGDLLRVGRTLHVGISSRTNEAALARLHDLLTPLGYRVNAVTVRGCLHLKSAATWIAGRTVVGNPAWVSPKDLGDVEFLEVDPGEPAAGNTLTEGGFTVLPAEYPRTRARIERAGFPVRTVAMSELLKAESGVTCSSLVFETGPPSRDA